MSETSEEIGNDRRWLRILKIEKRLCDRVDTLDAEGEKTRADFFQKRVERLRAIRDAIP